MKNAYFMKFQNWIICRKTKPMPLIYEEVKLDIGYRMDLLVEKKRCNRSEIL